MIRGLLRLLSTALLVAACTPQVASRPEAAPAARSNAPVRVVVLGVAQDGGLPHIGCTQEACRLAQRDPSRRQRVASLGLIDDLSGARFLIDASPDFVSQLASVNATRTSVDRGRPVDGILLTHAHIGHYTGLMYLGREALGARGVVVFASPRMGQFLSSNGPWSQLVALHNIEVKELVPGEELALTPNLHVTPLRVPHRDELSDTLGFRIRGPSRTGLYIPDIDKWDRWDERIEDQVASSSFALLDGTFRDPTELPGRALADVPHPFVSESIVRLRDHAAKVVFTHMNHTNRLLWDDVARREVRASGFRIASDGDVFEL